METDFVDLVQDDAGATPTTTTTTSTAVNTHRHDDDKTSAPNDADIFQFDDDSSASALASASTSKPVGKLTKLILSQPFAKNWFFRTKDSETGAGNRSIHLRPKQSREVAFLTPQTFC